MPETASPYNPLDKINIGNSVANAILSKNVLPLESLVSFEGAGIYSIYYRGTFSPYAPITNRNRSDFVIPIYVGKAVPDGARKGTGGLDSMSGSFLFKRLNDHKKSISQAENISIVEFFVKYLIVDDIWIPLGESLLIERFQPLWNIYIDGFGNHNPGNGRYNQQASSWDILHPGRPWATKLKSGKSITDVLKQVDAYMKTLIL